jgi:hypothetical protein
MNSTKPASEPISNGVTIVHIIVTRRYPLNCPRSIDGMRISAAIRSQRNSANDSILADFPNGRGDTRSLGLAQLDAKYDSIGFSSDGCSSRALAQASRRDQHPFTAGDPVPEFVPNGGQHRQRDCPNIGYDYQMTQLLPGNLRQAMNHIDRRALVRGDYGQ